MAPDQTRIYLDNAATSWPKPGSVLDAIQRFYQFGGAAAGRGSNQAVVDSNRLIRQTRTALADLLGVTDANRIAFTASATDALNMAIHGWLRPNDHVITTVCEHNSVIRPLRFLADRNQIEITTVPTTKHGAVSPQQIEAEFRPETRLVCVSAVSNVTGTPQPVEAISKICRQHSVPLLIDAAQAVGHYDIDIQSLDCDFLASAGHKGLLGPLGTGFLYVGPRVEAELVPIRQGGTGSDSQSEWQPEELPMRLECGNMNVGGLAGLLAGIQFIRKQGIESIGQKISSLCQMLRQRIQKIESVEIYPGKQLAQHATNIVSFNIGNLDPQHVASILDSTFRIQVRAGLHCAPKMHRQLNTLQRGGTVRVSPGFFNRIDEIDQLVNAIEQIARSC